MKTACLDLDDFSVINSRLDLLFQLRDYFQDFRISLFTVPVEIGIDRDWGISLIENELLATIKKNIDWMQIIPHGLTHNGSEMRDMNYDTFKMAMNETKIIFDRKGLPFEKGFKAPHWRWNKEVVRALDDEGWWGAVDPRQPNMSKPKRYYEYSHSIDNIDYSCDVLKLHGHIFGTRNDLGKCMENILKLPKDTNWKFVTDFITND